MGGETAAGGKEVVVLMERTSEPATHYEYRLLTSNTSTLQKELPGGSRRRLARRRSDGVRASMTGGKETAGILERNPDAPSTARYD